MDIYLYSFNKRNNSTKVPTGGLKVSGELKETSSILSPTVSFGDVEPSYNYAHIPSFGRYYWIRDWTYTSGLWEATMEVDVLASWKSVIGNSVQFVVRSSAEYDSGVIDSMYPATNVSTTVNVQDNSPFNPDNPMYIVGIMGKGLGGAITYYLMSESEFTQLGQYLLSDISYLGDDFGDKTAAMIKAEFNPLQYITNVVAIPYTPYGPFPTPYTTIYFGWWDLGFEGQVAPPNFNFNFEFSIPRHPQASRGEYLNGPPYSTYTLILPPFGMIPLDGNVLATGGTVDCRMLLDVKSNTVILNVFHDDVLLHQTSAQFGATVQIGQVATSKLDMVGNSLGIAGSLFEGDISGAISGAVDALKTVFPQTATKGSNGSLAIYKTTPTLYAKFMEITAEDNADIGKPLYQPRTISSLPGYVQTRNADIAAPATAEEISAIESALNGGIFYE